MRLDSTQKKIRKNRLKRAKSDKKFHERLRDISLPEDREIQQAIVEELQVLIDYYSNLLK